MNGIAYKVVSLLLSYPTKELLEAMPEIRCAIDASSLKKPIKASLNCLVDDIGHRDVYDAQERYVFLFDRTRSLSLHLFEHVHGESRDRGQAMVDMMAMYEADGFELGTKELPDYLPMFLEYLSTKPEAEARHLLGQTSHILAALHERLKSRQSVYAEAFAALEAITRQKPDPKLLNDLLQTPDDDPTDLEALDKIWEEEAVTFGGNAGEGACGLGRLKTQIRAAQRKPSQEVRSPNSEYGNHV